MPETHQPQRSVAYFEHEFATANPQIQKDVREILSHGFNTVVVTFSEKTLKDEKSRGFVKRFVKEAKKNGLACVADPWGIGKVFGGEGESPFVATGETPCFCNKHFDALMQNWVTTVHELGFQGIFWDEPAAKCDTHDEVALVEKYSTQAKALGLTNSVCVPADARQLQTLLNLASLPSIDGIGVDPYWPNVFSGERPNTEQNTYVAWWSDILFKFGEMTGKEPTAWIQGYEYNKGTASQMQRFRQIMTEHGIDNIAFWGFKGCESLFPNPAGESPQDIWEEAGRIFGGRRSLRPAS